MFQKGGYFHYCSPLAGSREFLKIAEYNYGINVEDFAKKDFILLRLQLKETKTLVVKPRKPAKQVIPTSASRLYGDVPAKNGWVLSQYSERGASFLPEWACVYMRG